MSLSLTLLAMYKTLYMSLMVLYGGEWGFAVSATWRKCVKQTVYQINKINYHQIFKVTNYVGVYFMSLKIKLPV
jgi:hypothetical protein